MKKTTAILSLVLMLCAAPALSWADGFSWSWPYGSGSVATDDAGQTGSASGAGDYGATPYSWSFSWNLPSQTATVDTTYGDNSYGFSGSWADIFAVLFGL